MDITTAWLIGIAAFIVLAIYITRQEKKKLLKLYTQALIKKNKLNAIAYGRKYYTLTEGRSNAAQINIELTIQNDLKMANIE